MNENTYRLCKIVLLATGVLGGLVLGWRASDKLAPPEFPQTGRYVQYDQQKQYSPDGKVEVNRVEILDTWTGKVIRP